MNSIMQSVIDTETAATVQVASLPLDPLGYGIDIMCFESIDPRAIDVDPLSTDAIAQDAFHALDTTKGQVIDDDSYGYDVVGLLNQATTQEVIYTAEQRIRLELEKDDRINAADVTAVATNGGKEWMITIRITPISPLNAFTLVLRATDGQVLFDSIGS